MATQISVTEQAIMEVTCKAADTYPRYADVIGRAGELLLAGKVEPVGEGEWFVRSRTRKGRTYTVTAQTCECEQFSYTGRGCLHQWAACYLFERAEARAAMLAANAERGALTEREKRRLSVWKWQYHLETNGFTKQQANGLLFARYRAWHNGQTKDRTEVA